MPLLFDGLRVVVCIGFLLWASYHDYMSREVPNRVWKLFLPVAIIFCIFDLYYEGFIFSYITQVGVSVAISVVVFILIFYLGFYGGADAKALICLSIAIPLTPQLGVFPLWGNLPLFPLSILNNTLVLSIATFPYALISNTLWKVRSKEPLFKGLESEPLRRKLFALLFCVRRRKSELKTYDTIAERIETIEGNRIRKIKVSWRVTEEGDEKIDFESLPESVFVDFSLPMLLFITAGFIVSLIVGDLIFWVVGKIFFTPLV